jgi:hypothetical protein
MAKIKSSTPEERKSTQKIRAAAIEALLLLRKQQRPVSDEEIWQARQEGRP